MTTRTSGSGDGTVADVDKTANHNDGSAEVRGRNLGSDRALAGGVGPNAEQPLNDAAVAISNAEAAVARAATAFARLTGIVQTLRGPGGCPWDRAQSIDSMRAHLLEETYEVLEAIESGDADAHREELGDLLFQIVFHAQLRWESGGFDASDVAHDIATKLVRRHPHVFGHGEPTATDGRTAIAAQTATWHELKAREGRRSAVDGVPGALPALARAARLGEKAAAAGFDWRSPTGVLLKIDEERAEIEEALANGDPQALEDEIGDYLFSVVNLARHLNVDAESALRGTAARFEARFRKMEADITADGHRIRELADPELEARWQRAKAMLADEG